jgi:hypothetical protein
MHYYSVDDEIKASARGRLHGLRRESVTTEASVATAKQAHKKRYEYAPPDCEPANRKEQAADRLGLGDGTVDIP